MGKRCAAASFRSQHTARRGYAGREQFPLLLQFFDPTTSSSPFSSVLSAWAAASVTRAWRLKRSKNRSSFGIKARNQPSISYSYELNRCRKDAARTISEFKPGGHKTRYGSSTTQAIEAPRHAFPLRPESDCHRSKCDLSLSANRDLTRCSKQRPIRSTRRRARA